MDHVDGVSVIVLGQDCGLDPDGAITPADLRKVAEVFSTAADILEKATKCPHGAVRHHPEGGELTEIGFDDNRKEWNEENGLPVLKEIL